MEIFEKCKRYFGDHWLNLTHTNLINKIKIHESKDGFVITVDFGGSISLENHNGETLIKLEVKK